MSTPTDASAHLHMHYKSLTRKNVLDKLLALRSHRSIITDTHQHLLSHTWFRYCGQYILGLPSICPSPAILPRSLPAFPERATIGSRGEVRDACPRAAVLQRVGAGQRGNDRAEADAAVRLVEDDREILVVEDPLDVAGLKVLEIRKDSLQARDPQLKLLRPPCTVLDVLIMPTPAKGIRSLPCPEIQECVTCLPPLLDVEGQVRIINGKRLWWPHLQQDLQRTL